MLPMLTVHAPREEKKKKQKQEGCDTEEKTEISSGEPAADQGSKGGGGPSQPPLKRGQKVREGRGDKMFFVLWTKSRTVILHLTIHCC